MLARLVALCAALSVLACGCATSSAASGPARRIRYVVIPHPDDELAVWSMVGRDTAHYLVFIMLAYGELTSSCSGHGLQVDLGERAPQPQPFTGTGTPACGDERVDSFNAFLDGMAAIDPEMERLPKGRAVTGAVLAGDEAPKRCEPNGACLPAPTYQLAVGKRQARLVFNLGDRQTTPGEDTWTIQTARRIRNQFPVHAEDDIVGSTYLNLADHRFFIYDHPDQQSLAVALHDHRQGVPGPQWGRTWPGDPRPTTRFNVDPRIFAGATSVSPGPVDPVSNPNARRTGVFQQVYGWTAFGGAYWYAEPTPIHSFYSAEQDFWRA